MITKATIILTSNPTPKWIVYSQDS